MKFSRLVFFIVIAISGKQLFAEGDQKSSVRNYAKILRTVQVFTYIIDKKDMSNEPKPTGESFLLNEGQYLKFSNYGKEKKSIWFEMPNTNGTELVGIPKYTETGQPITAKLPRFLQNKSLNKLLTPTELNFEIIKSFDEAKLYVDAEPGKRVYLTKKPNVNGKDCGSNNDQNNIICTAAPSTDDPLKIIDTKVFYVKEPNSDNYDPKLFYLVKTTYCSNGSLYKKCTGTLYTDKTGWIDADKVSPTKRDQIPMVYNNFIPQFMQKPKAPETPKPPLVVRKTQCPDPLTKNIEQLTSVAESTKELQFKLDVLNNVGHCLDQDGYITKVNALDQKLAKVSLDKYGGQWNSELNRERKGELEKIGKEVFGKNNKSGSQDSVFAKLVKPTFTERLPQEVSGNKLTNQQLYEIDVLARSLFGEMRSCSDQTPAYYQAITRVMLNRAALVKANGPTLPFVRSKNLNDYKIGTSVDKILPDVPSAYKQISSWNPNDVNLKINLCPLSSTTTTKEKDAWISAVKVAYDAVVNRKSFLESTKNITHLYYSSNMIPEWAIEMNMTQDVKFKIDNQEYSNSKCLILWKDNNNEPIKQLVKTKGAYTLNDFRPSFF